MSDETNIPDREAGHRAPLGYHLTLLEDPHRMDCFERAIRHLVRPGMTVLDVGAGTGILSMLAARAGAAKVHAVESMPVAGLARQLAARNGFETIIEVHHADMRSLPPIEPVDLIVSDCLGRFLVDDNMMSALEAATKWLKPTGTLCPSRIELKLAPVGNLPLRPVQGFRDRIYGLDFSPSIPYALNYCYHGIYGEESLLAEPQNYHTWDLCEPAPKLDRSVRFELSGGGILTGVLGWFEATCAPGIVLNSGPGVQTHWGQYAFPLLDVRCETSDALRFRLQLSEEPELCWRWNGELSRNNVQTTSFSHESIERLGERPVDTTPVECADMNLDEIRGLNGRGEKAFEEERFEDARAAFEEAISRLPGELEELAPDLYENLGITFAHLGRPVPALRAFFRALDGDFAAREQSLRFAINCFAGQGCFFDARRLLKVYNDTFGEHPGGWTVENLTPHWQKAATHRSHKRP